MHGMYVKRRKSGRWT